MVAGMRLAPLPVVSATGGARPAAVTAAASRVDRQCSTSATISASTAGSTLTMASAPPSGDAAVSVKRFTPTTTCSPLSIRRARAAMERTSRALSSSTASKRAAELKTSSNSAAAAA